MNGDKLYSRRCRALVDELTSGRYPLLASSRMLTIVNDGRALSSTWDKQSVAHFLLYMQRSPQTFVDAVNAVIESCWGRLRIIDTGEAITDGIAELLEAELVKVRKT